jgi:triosephosphate isomerase
MQLSYDESIAWFQANQQELGQLSQKTGHEIAICPSFDAIASASTLLKKSKSIKLGAQDCSTQDKGAYTGQVSALSLKQLGVSYCLAGHSERRQYQCERDKEIAQKAFEAFNRGIEPIICIGETKSERDNHLTEQVLLGQMTPLTNAIKKFPGSPYCIAYEPIWAIGTGIIPSLMQVNKVLNYLKKIVVYSPRLLYGGSVNDRNVQELATLDFLDGFLIGGASTDMQTLKKIVLSI